MKSKDIGITLFVCPRCQQRCSRMPYTGDFEHNCFGSEVLANEDIPLIGKWSDFTGSDNKVPSTFITQAGTINTLRGTRADLEGAKNFPRTSRGFNKQTHRTRKHIHSISEDSFETRGIRDSQPATSNKV